MRILSSAFITWLQTTDRVVKYVCGPTPRADVSALWVVLYFVGCCLLSCVVCDGLGHSVDLN
jgi:hypothetical protein